MTVTARCGFRRRSWRRPAPFSSERCNTFTEDTLCALCRSDELLAARGLRVTRLARGVQVGGELEYVDAGTLAQAPRERKSMRS